MYVPLYLEMALIILIIIYKINNVYCKTVNNFKNTFYYVDKELPDDLEISSVFDISSSNIR